MNAIRATWTNGQIVPAEPVDWPEGAQLVVEPVPAGEKMGLTEEQWRDDAESIDDERSPEMSFEAYLRMMPDVGTDGDFARIEGAIRDVALGD